MFRMFLAVCRRCGVNLASPLVSLFTAAVENKGFIDQSGILDLILIGNTSIILLTSGSMCPMNT